MKHKLKKFTSVLLAVIMLFGIMAIAPINAGAAVVDNVTVSTQSKSGNFASGYTVTGDGASDMVSIAKAQIGRTESQFGYTESWCADFVSDCAKLAGQSSAVPANGLVSSLYTAVTNAGGTITTSPKAGDLVFYYSGRWCHVGIMIDSTNMISGNMLSDGDWKVVKIKYTDYRDTNDKSAAATFVRPAYKNTGSSDTSPTLDFTPQNWGNFYSIILIYDIWKPIGADDSNNVVPQNEDGRSEQYWYFEYQSDGSYKIINASNGKCLDVQGGAKTNGTNVQIYTDNGTDSQRWYIRTSGAKFCLVPKVNTDMVLEIAGGYTGIGCNIQIYEFNDTSAQKLAIYRGSEIQYASPVLTAEYNTDTEEVDFSWTQSGYVREFNLNIWKGSANIGNAYYSSLGMTYSTRSKSVSLEEGYYEAYLESVNAFGSKTSNKVTITVTEKETSVSAVTIAESEIIIGIDEGYQLTAKIEPSNASTSYTWSSSDISVASVDDKGFVTAQGEGTAVITVTTSNGLTASCNVTVNTSSDILPGDINDDGKVNMKDIVLLQKFLNGWEVTINEQAANVNGDSEINMKDIVLLQKYLNGWNVVLK